MSISCVPDEFLQCALSLEEDIGVSEYAWEAIMAIKLIHALESSQIVIFGGDVYQKLDGKICPTYMNWSCDRRKNEPLVEYALRSKQEALNFINFSEKTMNTTLYYVLVFSEKGSMGLF